MKFLDAVFPDRTPYTIQGEIERLQLHSLEDSGTYPVGSYYLPSQWIKALTDPRSHLEVLMDWDRAGPIGSVLYTVHSRRVDIQKVTVHQDSPNSVFRLLLGTLLKQLSDQVGWKFVVHLHQQDHHWRKEFETLGFHVAHILQEGDDTVEEYIRH